VSREHVSLLRCIYISDLIREEHDAIALPKQGSDKSCESLLNRTSMLSIVRRVISSLSAIPFTRQSECEYRKPLLEGYCQIRRIACMQDNLCKYHLHDRPWPHLSSIYASTSPNPQSPSQSLGYDQTSARPRHLSTNSSKSPGMLTGCHFFRPYESTSQPNGEEK
jgi:hypothetical protein